MAVRSYKFVQFLRNGRTGEPLFNHDMLLRGLAFRSIKGWAYVLHDKDEGVEPHYHVALWTDVNLEPQTLARWFGVPEGMVERVKGGRAGLLRTLQYMTHERQSEQADGKYPYPDDEVVASEGWDWRYDVNEAERRQTASRGRRGSRSIDLEVREEGLSVRDAIRRGTSVPINRLRRQRAAHLADQRSLESRVNFYVHGPDTLGAKALAKGLALSLAAQGNGQVFTLRNSIDEYDGESVIFVPDANPSRMVHSLDDDPISGRRSLFEALTLLPQGSMVSTSFGPSQLVHRSVVMSGKAPFETFRRGLESVYAMVTTTAEKDSYVHLPVIVPVSADDFGLQINRALADGGAYDQYLTLGRVRAAIQPAMQAAAAVQGDDGSLHGVLMERQFRAAIEASDRVREELSRGARSRDDVLAEFEDLGELLPAD